MARTTRGHRRYAEAVHAQNRSSELRQYQIKVSEILLWAALDVLAAAGLQTFMDFGRLHDRHQRFRVFAPPDTPIV